jgi:hypothetical protein
MKIAFLGAPGTAGSPGIVVVDDAAGRLALTGYDGMYVHQKDTDETWVYNGIWPGGQWDLYADKGTVMYAAGTNSTSVAVGTNAGSPNTTQPVTLTVNVKRSATGADANYIATEIKEETDGLRAQTANSLVRGLFAGTAPVTYTVGTGTFSMAAATDAVNGYMTAADHTSLTNVIANLAAHIASATAHTAANLVNVPAGTIAATTVQAAINELDGDVQAHVGSTTAHTAANIVVTPVGNLVANRVQSALQELDSDLTTTNTNLTNHISSTSAHTAANLTNDAVGVTGTKVKDALETLAGIAAKGTFTHTNQSASVASLTWTVPTYPTNRFFTINEFNAAAITSIQNGDFDGQELAIIAQITTAGSYFELTPGANTVLAQPMVFTDNDSITLRWSVILTKWVEVGRVE